MYRNQQHIINTHTSSSSCLPKSKFNALMNEYGISKYRQNHNTKLKTSKSHKDILIAKNKKLIDFFPIHHNKQTQYKIHDINKPLVTNNHKKLTLSISKNVDIHLPPKQSLEIQTFRTSYFGQALPEIKNENLIKQNNEKAKNTILQETLQSDRNQAKKIKQRLKKSTSMQNLIQQRYLSQTHKKQKAKNINMKENVYTTQNCSDYTSQTYDSTKYNWRLSRSKEKSREKSLSALQSKANMINSFHKKQELKAKLHIDLNRNKLKNEKMKNYQQTKKHNQLSKNKFYHFNKLHKQEDDDMTYTFGSDVYNSNHYD